VDVKVIINRKEGRMEREGEAVVMVVVVGCVISILIFNRNFK
jgi:hypothetical protein